MVYGWKNHFSVPSETLEEAQRLLTRRGIAPIPNLWNHNLNSIFLAESDRLLRTFGRRRDFVMQQTGNTPRRMTNVSALDIARNSDAIRDLYEDESLRSVASAIAGQELHDCPYLPERFVLTNLHKAGDTHGWHWDDYSFAVVFVLRAPDPGDGGLVQSVFPTSWNKENPALMMQFLSRPIATNFFPTGSIYIMRTRESLHRILPILGNTAQRTILNFCYATSGDLERKISHETVDRLWN